MKSNKIIFYLHGLICLMFFACHQEINIKDSRNICELISSHDVFKHYYCYQDSDSLFLEKWDSVYFDSLYRVAKEYDYFLSAQKGFEIYKDTFKIEVDSFYKLPSGTPMVRLFIYSDIYSEAYFLKTQYVMVTLFGPYMKLLSMRGWKYEKNDTSKVIKKDSKVGVYFRIDLGPILESSEYKKFLKKNKCSRITFEDIVKAHNFYVKGYVTDQYD